ncbi:two-component system histidine kinase [Amycolatopsis mediterranei S699]|uniref:histidine kinase n=2 Tax=Amycolatopsis mediterranei TaxID=33910 RepID=A0A0H3D984_AMYMU|nr:ATP-binding protein [Amycolatopsis mediterranei]AFO78553.1 two-component system histidine kinase [Amycolatopsis mediterranei S699]ADJ46842.1 two-component system histidine kinase [Amycolatopsis mediterranei U32]AGT85681.1 two-component system histidine kinase [Amycolatopsis mediterranei RB]KDO04725.1 histidine kinase [Amycolatopsis mediterranei]KDU85792.1 histidine kinase [Amycolatopsis mediterranei]
MPLNLPVRTRLTAVYVLTAAVLTAIGIVLFAATLDLGLDHRLDGQLRSRAVRLARVVARDGPAAVHAMTPAHANLLIQLIDPSGKAAAGSPDLGGVTLLDAGQVKSARRGGGYRTVGTGPDYRLYATPAETAAGTWTVVVATPLDLQNDLTRRVTWWLSGAAAVTVLVGGWGAWLLAGAALRPVEQLRREVSGISETDPSTPVRVPGTGDEVAALAETMNALLARISAGLTRQRQFVADASHEVRTPLTNLRTTLELAGAPGRSLPELREAVRHAEQETIRLGRLVDDLLVLAADDDHVPVDRMPGQPVLPLLDAAVTAARPVAAGKEVDLRVVADGSLAAPLHPGRIRQVLDNLLANALRHAPPGSEVVLSATADGDGLLIEVADEGPGFADGFAEQAFERFRRADTARSRAGGGSGLGLAVVRAVARAHGGEAAAANRPSGGARVGIRIPLG